MSQMKYVVDPFGEVNVYPQPGGKLRVTATILMEPQREGTQTGIAIDGSGSMRKLFGASGRGGVHSSIFASREVHENIVSPVAQKVCAHLARNLDADGGTTCIYWATGSGGAEVEVIGDFHADEVERYTFVGPNTFGTGTQLLPAVEYFVDRFDDADWGFYVFITDGELHDLDEVMDYSRRLARAVANGKRNPLKFVLIGVGPDVNERQMEKLDDLDTGTDIDLWDHKIATEMRVLQQIFAEVVDKNARVADSGKILTPDGRVVKNYSDTGVPALLQFEVPANCEYFTLEVPGYRVHQPLRENAIIPEQEVVRERCKPVQAEVVSERLKPPVQPAPAQPKPAAKEEEIPIAEAIAEEQQKENDPGIFDFKLEFEKDPMEIKLDPSDVKKPDH